MRVFNARLNRHSLKGSPLKKVMIIIGLVLLGIVTVIALAAIFGFAVQWLWNALMPEVFNLPEVSYWQAVGLVVLAQIFFGNHSSYSRNNRSEHGKDEKHVHISDDGQHHNYESFGAFWENYGRNAFKEWLTRENAGVQHNDT
jgi:hypothetical protein